MLLVPTQFKNPIEPISLFYIASHLFNLDPSYFVYSTNQHGFSTFQCPPIHCGLRGPAQILICACNPYRIKELRTITMQTTFFNKHTDTDPSTVWVFGAKKTVRGRFILSFHSYRIVFFSATTHLHTYTMVHLELSNQFFNTI